MLASMHPTSPLSQPEMWTTIFLVIYIFKLTFREIKAPENNFNIDHNIGKKEAYKISALISN